MEVVKYGLRHTTTTTAMINRRARYLFAMAASSATGVLYNNDHARTFLTTFPPLLKASKPPEDNSWFSNLLTRKDSNIKPALSAEFVSSLLSKQEYSRPTRIGVVSWFETNHYSANVPIEDRHCECYLQENDALFFGIFDGHSGWHCSESLRMRLPVYISLAMMNENNRKDLLGKALKTNDLVEYLGNPEDDCVSFKLPDTFEEKQKAIKSGHVHFAEKASDMAPKLSKGDVLKYAYLSLDRDITREAIPDGKCNEAIWTGLSGAVTVGAYIEGEDLYIANTGDCRAVLGTKSNTGSWLSIPMSEDHTVDNMAEVNRLKSEHPGEENNVIRNGRLLGQLQPLRSFGDVVYKWSVELHRKVLDVLYGRQAVPEFMYLTPPYLTAQPDIGHKELAEDDRFLVIATDGLWETVTSEMAVKIVGKYLDELSKGEKPKENASTRLIRYALGGGSEYRLADMIQIPAHQKRDFHDDITVTVVFFDNASSVRSKL